MLDMIEKLPTTMRAFRRRFTRTWIRDREYAGGRAVKF
jgi:hypothetical protein